MRFAYSVREGRTTYSLIRASENPRATWRYWAGTAAFGGGSSYRASRFAAIFEAIPTRVVGTRTVNGTTLYELEGRRAESAAFTAGPADAVGYRDGLVAAGDGRVARYEDGAWTTLADLADVRAVDGDMVAAAGGVHRLDGTHVGQIGRASCRERV